MAFDALMDYAALDACAELLLDLVEGATELSIYDDQGRRVWGHRADDGREARETLWIHPGDASWQVLEVGVSYQAVSPQRHLFVASIPCEDCEQSACLFLEQRVSSSAISILAHQSAQRAVACLSQLVGSQYALNSELNLMTDELARRYEELNLIYNTDEQIRSLAEKQTVLHDVVDNCIDYLNIDMAALFLIEDSVVISRHRDAEPAAQDEIIHEARDTVFQIMAMNSNSVVLNTSDERLSAGLEASFEYKMVASPLRDAEGRLHGALVIFSHLNSRDFDNGDRNLLNATAEKLSKIVSADYDGLTGLLTREGFEQAVADVLGDAQQCGRDVCVLHANIDQLQLVNDTFGHEAGDDLIRQVAGLLPTLLRGNDRVSRLGGDEFGILLLDCSLENAIRMAERVCERVSKLPCRVGDRQLNVGISVGVAKIDDDVDSVIAAMATADLACSVAKEQGRSRAFAYRSDDEEMKARKHQMHWVGEIQSGLRKNRFVLFSQRIESTRRPDDNVHFEILLRMLGNGDKVLSPFVFMPVAERYHLMPAIDRWVIEHSLRTLEEWASDGLYADAVFTINLSGQSLMDERTLSFLLDKLRTTQARTHRLCFEITENAAITDLHNAQRFISSVKRFGCKFALDDFGAGVSSFANLRALDVDYLKIDGSFVVDMVSDPVSASMVAAINQVGQTMKLSTVAEFVESSEIRQLLVEQGVDYLQGYDIARPRPLLEQLQEHTLADARSA